MNNQVLMEIIDIGRYFLIESDSDSDDDNATERTEKIWGFAEEVVPKFKDNQFREHFRMSATTFESLLIKMHNAEDHIMHSGHPELTLEKQLMITVWYLANVESFRQVGLKFGITKSTCWNVLYRVCKKLLIVNQQYGIIEWPSPNRSREIMQGFEEVSQFPGVIGAIDGCHIEILKPREHPNSYINRKGYPSILLQGICDHRKLFTDVFTGVPGSVHDSRLYRMSDVCHRVEQNLVGFPNNGHLIGDLAYVLSEKLLVGFKDNGNLNNFQRNFNFKLSRARVVIENAFAWLKGRFRRLKMLETVREDLIALLIIAACILHNVCILEGDLPEDFNLDIPGNIENGIEQVPEENLRRNLDNLNARAKRLEIMYQLEQNH